MKKKTDPCRRIRHVEAPSVAPKRVAPLVDHFKASRVSLCLPADRPQRPADAVGFVDNFLVVVGRGSDSGGGSDGRRRHQASRRGRRRPGDASACPVPEARRTAARRPLSVAALGGAAPPVRPRNAGVRRTGPAAGGGRRHEQPEAGLHGRGEVLSRGAVVQDALLRGLEGRPGRKHDVGLLARDGGPAVERVPRYVPCYRESATSVVGPAAPLVVPAGAACW